MAKVLFHLNYSLNRRQRLIPHLRIWTFPLVILVVLLFVFFVIESILSSIGFFVFAILLFVFFKSLFRGLLEVLFVPIRRMDITFETNDYDDMAAGILIGKNRWYLFLDGITSIEKLQKNTWTLLHYNGMVLHISASAITEDQISFIRSVADQGHTPEGIRKVVERGKRIQLWSRVRE